MLVILYKLNEGKTAFDGKGSALSKLGGKNHLNENYCLRSFHFKFISSLERALKIMLESYTRQLINDMEVYTVVQTQRRQKQISPHLTFLVRIQRSKKQYRVM